ncbi:alpha/beta fold hydrolase [Caballeronia sp. BR00000012568055]|uniref:alpha/beta fold hydrolase n=1 Tax=Caballeronia sp. BR00000012568055 TaxID=2918761 RepID=UPI0023F6763E|nr:alpha/beta hydrolase [Caballeronia sp. BR00000012568055]
MLEFVRHVTTPTLDIAYADTGPAEGPVVVLLHGWPDAARGWSAVADRLNAAGYRTVVPELRGAGGTRFLQADAVRDGSAVAIVQDAIDLADALGIDQFDLAGHDWGARAAYTAAALYPQRVRRIAALSVGFQPAGVFELPDFAQARRYWYQWFMSLDDGPKKVAADPKGFARIQWDTWAPAGWFEEAEFEASARAFENPDWVAITLNAYRRRYRKDEASDPALTSLYDKLATVNTLATPTLVIHGGADTCTDESTSAGQEGHFTGGYRRVVIDGVGHFPQREAPDAVADALIAHFSEK